MSLISKKNFINNSIYKVICNNESLYLMEYKLIRLKYIELFNMLIYISFCTKYKKY